MAFGDILDKGKEFIASEPPDEIALAEGRLQNLGHMEQCRVALRMAVQIIDLFKIINVEKNQGTAGRFVGAVHEGFDFSLEGTPVIDLCEWICICGRYLGKLPFFVHIDIL